MTILDKNTEILLLHKQLETLKQEIYCESQLAQIYSDELKDTKRELRCLENKLNTLVKSDRLGLEQAKELAQLIFKRNMPVSECLAKLLSAIYNSTTKSTELAQRDIRPSFKIKPARRSNGLTSGHFKQQMRLPC